MAEKRPTSQGSWYDMCIEEEREERERAECRERAAAAAVRRLERVSQERENTDRQASAHRIRQEAQQAVIRVIEAILVNLPEETARSNQPRAAAETRQLSLGEARSQGAIPKRLTTGATVAAVPIAAGAVNQQPAPVERETLEVVASIDNTMRELRGGDEVELESVQAERELRDYLSTSAPTSRAAGDLGPRPESEGAPAPPEWKEPDLPPEYRVTRQSQQEGWPMDVTEEDWDATPPIATYTPPVVSETRQSRGARRRARRYNPNRQLTTDDYTSATMATPEPPSPPGPPCRPAAQSRREESVRRERERRESPRRENPRRESPRRDFHREDIRRSNPFRINAPSEGDLRNALNSRRENERVMGNVRCTREGSSLQDRRGSTSYSSRTPESSSEQRHRESRSLPPRTNGVMFGGLKPIPTDSRIDPPPYTCYNCWQWGHDARRCQRPKTRVYCANCGRRGVDLSNCPRCSEVHQDFRQRTFAHEREFELQMERRNREELRREREDAERRERAREERHRCYRGNEREVACQAPASRREAEVHGREGCRGGRCTQTASSVTHSHVTQSLPATQRPSARDSRREERSQVQQDTADPRIHVVEAVRLLEGLQGLPDDTRDMVLRAVYREAARRRE